MESVDHQWAVSGGCNQVGWLYTRFGWSTDGITYRGERVKYRFDGSTLVQHSSRARPVDGSGDLIPLRGGARLQVTALAPDYDDAGQVTYGRRAARNW